MRRSKAEAAATREHIVATAARLLRKRGIAGVGVAELMKQAGLTHGGFYKHFASKDMLVAEACDLALDEARAGLADAAQSAPREKALQALVYNYLSPAHRDRPENGCAIAALGNEAVRDEAPVRRALADGIREFVELTAAQLEDLPPEVARMEATGVVAAMIGGLLMARATEDPTRSEQVLKDVQHFILHGAED